MYTYIIYIHIHIHIGYKRVSKEARNKVNTNQMFMGQEIDRNSFTVTFNEQNTSSSSSSSSYPYSHPTTSGTATHTTTAAAALRATAKDLQLPEFLQSSHVITAEQLQAQRLLDQGTTADKEQTLLASVKTVSSVLAAPPVPVSEEAVDDVDWEDD